MVAKDHNKHPRQMEPRIAEHSTYLPLIFTASARWMEGLLGARISILPIPDLAQEVGHVDFLALHLDHPWVLHHAPGRGSARRFFFEAVYFSD